MFLMLNIPLRADKEDRQLLEWEVGCACSLVSGVPTVFASV